LYLGFKICREPMFQEILDSLENFSLKDLYHFKDRLDLLIKKKNYAEQSTLDKRISHRARVKISGSATIEREREFFDLAHKINIQEMSINGLVLTIHATVIQDDILIATFRIPSSGEKKIVNCKVKRVKEIQLNRNTVYEVAAQAVDKSEVKIYRDMLNKRGK
jgi:hypothetical protein